MNLPLFANIEETASTGTTNIGMSIASMGAFVEGENKLIGTINSGISSYLSNGFTPNKGFLFLQK